MIYSVLSFPLFACQSELLKPQSSVVVQSQLSSGLTTLSQHVYSTHDEVMAQTALEDNYTKQPLIWYSNSQTKLTVIPTNTFENKQGVYCRSYESKEVSGGKDISLGSVACRIDNIWIIQ